MSGSDVFVGMRLNSSSRPDHDPRPHPEPLSQSAEPADFIKGVDDDPSYSGRQGVTQFLIALVVAVQPDPPQIDSGPLHHSQLTAGADIDAESLVDHPTCHRRTQEGFGRVVDIPSLKGLSEGAGSVAQISLVHHVHRSADLAGNVDHAQTGYGEYPVLLLAYAAAPQTRQQCVDVTRHAQPTGSSCAGVGVDRAGDMGMCHIAKLCQTRSETPRFTRSRTSELLVTRSVVWPNSASV